MSKIGDNPTLISGIKKLRNYKNITQAELAKELHLSTRTIISWENGQSEVTFENLKLICDTFKCSLDYLFGRTDYFCETEKFEELKTDLATNKDFRKMFNIKFSNLPSNEEDKYFLLEMNINKYSLEYYMELTELKEKLEKNNITESEYNFEKEKLEKEYSSVLANSNTMIKYICHKMTIENEKQN